MLKRGNNEDYYDLIKEYQKITGLPVLLNTSFNLHGDAIVENAIQAINTFKKSKLRPPSKPPFKPTTLETKKSLTPSIKLLKKVVN